MCIIKIVIYGIKEVTYHNTNITSEGVDKEYGLFWRDDLKQEMELFIGRAWIE